MPLDLRRDIGYLHANVVMARKSSIYFGVDFLKLFDILHIPGRKAKRDYRFLQSVIPLKFLEAAIGVEPMNKGFADLRLRPLGHAANYKVRNPISNKNWVS